MVASAGHVHARGMGNPFKVTAHQSKGSRVNEKGCVSNTLFIHAFPLAGFLFPRFIEGQQSTRKTQDLGF